MKTVHDSLKKLSLKGNYLICGQTMAGKTQIVKELLLHHHEMFKEQISHIIYVYSVWQQDYAELESSLQDLIQFRTDVPSMQEIQERSKGGTQ